MQQRTPRRTVPSDPCADGTPVFGFILIGGSLTGAQVRDIRLANELHRRGHQVHVWWAIDRPKTSSLDPGISQRWLFHSFRYAVGGTSGMLDACGRWSSRMLGDRFRSALAQAIPWLVSGTLRGVIRAVCAGVESDRRLIRRFARELTEAGVTHLLPTLEFFAPFAAAARALVPHRLRYLVTFQGYETYAPYARKLDLVESLYRRIYQAVEQSDWPAVAVSSQYIERIRREIGLPAEWLCDIPPGIPVAQPMDKERALDLVRRQFPAFQSHVPLVSYLGRRDSEKGIDLLLYAVKILRERGLTFQLAICGPTAFGSRYGVACRQIGDILQLPVLWSEYVSNEVRSALFGASHCLVYPSIHEEPFGMVPVEAMSLGTPVIVPDIGGVSRLPFLGEEQAGLTFRSWDSGHLACQLNLLLTDTELHAEFAAAAPRIARHYSVECLADRMLEHLGLLDTVPLIGSGYLNESQRRSAA